jgi:tetratricopeptide (TPR) repeat protein
LAKLGEVSNEGPFLLGPREVDRASERLSDTITKVSQRGRLIVGLDNLQYADPSSLLTLEDLLKNRGTPSFLILSTTGDRNGYETEALSDYLPLEDPQTVDLRLTCLTDQEADTLLRLAYPDMIGLHRDIVRSRLGGVPGLLVDRILVNAVLEEPCRIHPDAVTHWMQDKISGLTAEQRLLGRIVAALRDPVDADALRDLLPAKDPFELLTLLQGLVDRGVIVRRNGKFCPASGVLRAAIDSEMTLAERRLLHESLVRNANGALGMPLQEVAYHTRQAGLPTEALQEALVEEANRLEARHALPEALESLLAAGGLGNSGARTTEAILWRTGRLAETLRRHGLAVESFAEIERQAHLEGNEVEALRAGVDQATNQARLDPNGVSIPHLSSSVTRCIELDEFPIASRGLELALSLLDFQGDSPEMRRLLHEADRLSEMSTDPTSSAWVSLARARYVYLGQPYLGLSSAMQAVSLAREVNDDRLVGRALNRLVVCLMFLGRLNLPEGAGVVDECTTHIRRTGDALLKQDLTYNLSNWCLDTGNIEESQVRFELLLQDLPSRVAPLELVRLHIMEGELSLKQGLPAKALECFQKAGHLEGGLKGTHRLHNQAGKVLALLDLGRIREAHAEAACLASASPRDRYSHNPSLIALAKARLLRRQGRADAALDVLEAYADRAKECMIPCALLLRLEQYRLMVRLGMRIPSAQIQETLLMAEERRLDQRAQELRAFLP